MRTDTPMRRRLLIGVLAWPHTAAGVVPARKPVSIVEARPDAINPRVAVVRYAGKLYRLPMEYLAPVERT